MALHGRRDKPGPRWKRHTRMTIHWSILVAQRAQTPVHTPPPRGALTLPNIRLLRSFPERIKPFSSLTWRAQTSVTWTWISSVLVCAQEPILKAPALTGLQTLVQERSERNQSWPSWRTEGHSSPKMSGSWNCPLTAKKAPVVLSRWFPNEERLPQHSQAWRRE